MRAVNFPRSAPVGRENSQTDFVYTILQLYPYKVFQEVSSFKLALHQVTVWISFYSVCKLILLLGVCTVGTPPNYIYM